MDMEIISEPQPKILPLIALRGMTMFPGMRLSFELERPISVGAVNAGMDGDQYVFMVAQKDSAEEQPVGEDSLYKIGTVCRIKQVLRLPDEKSTRVMVEGLDRAALIRIVSKKPYFSAQVEVIPPENDVRTAVRSEALIRQCFGLLEEYAGVADVDIRDMTSHLLDSTDPGYVADHVAQNISMRHSQKQAILEELRPVRRIALVNRMLRREIDIMQVEQSLHEHTSQQIFQSQREMFLREQMKAIQAELGEMGDTGDDIEDYRSAIAAADLPEEVEEKLNKEVMRLAKQPFGSSEASVIRGYLDECLEIPWNVETPDELDTAAVRKKLDADHFGLTKIKDRIIEYLSVRKLAPEEKGSILCLVGPPGTGKTSIAQSIAAAMGRKLCRISLGGVHDEAEIRGHRKTYVGAMPGRIMAGIAQAGSKNPVMVLDEIDKLGSDYRGDPSAALLEALDPEQNGKFRDHFLELPFDLSGVFFITTANVTDTIPPALLDRMEIIELSSYTDEEKLSIAKEHLLPKQRKKHGLNGRQLRVSDDAIREIIARYTRESGVRRLEQQLATVCRKTAASIVAGEIKSRYLRADGLEAVLGAPKRRNDRTGETPEVGLVHGLAWTSVGGEMLDAEVTVMEGTGKLELTGNLGDVMKESAHAALSYIRSHTKELGIEPTFYKDKDIHIHFPEGAVPKDGPSAGVTVTTGLVSALTGIPVRQDIAMTGEITIRGRVLPIGGLREKTMAALRAGIHTVILPAENESDLEEIDPAVRKALRFVTVSRAEDVLETALCRGEAHEV